MEQAWKILDRGDVPEKASTIAYSCPACGHDAELPVIGLAIAQLRGGGLIFDPGPRSLPAVIQCRRCRRKFTSISEEMEG